MMPPKCTKKSWGKNKIGVRLTTWIPKFRRLMPSGTRGGKNIGCPSLGSIVKRSTVRNEEVTVSRLTSSAVISNPIFSLEDDAGDGDNECKCMFGFDEEESELAPGVAPVPVTSGVSGTGETEPEDGSATVVAVTADFGVEMTVTLLMLL